MCTPRDFVAFYHVYFLNSDSIIVYFKIMITDTCSLIGQFGYSVLGQFGETTTTLIFN